VIRRAGVCRSRRAASVVEFLVAASLVLVIITASSITLRTTQRSIARDRARDTVTVLASNVLEQAALFDCQLSVEPALSVRLGDQQQGSGPTPCVKLMFDDPSNAENYAVDGDFLYLTRRPGCATSCDTLVVVVSRWLPLGDSVYRCRTATAAPAGMLERRAHVTWTPSGAGASLTNEFVSVEAAPRSSAFTDPSRTAIAVPANPGEVVLVRETSRPGSTAGALLRVASPCVNTDGSTGAEAYFPFLDVGADLEVVLTGSCVALGTAGSSTGCPAPASTSAALSVFYGQNPPSRSTEVLPVETLRSCSAGLLRLDGGRFRCEKPGRQ
jgi:hypothetical protein